MEPPEEDEERFSAPDDFEENLRGVLGVDPDSMEDEEEPPQE
jgi:hypothetical protein